MASLNIIAEELFAELEKKEDVTNDFIDEIDNFSSFFRTDKENIGERNYAFFEALADFMERLSVLYQSYNNYLKEKHTIQNNVFKVSKKLSTSPRDIVSFTQRVEILSKRIDSLNVKAEILFNESEIIKEKYAEFLK